VEVEMIGTDGKGGVLVVNLGKNQGISSWGIV